VSLAVSLLPVYSRLFCSRGKHTRALTCFLHSHRCSQVKPHKRKQSACAAVVFWHRCCHVLICNLRQKQCIQTRTMPVLGGTAGGKADDFKDALEQPLKHSSQSEGAKAPGAVEQGACYLLVNRARCTVHPLDMPCPWYTAVLRWATQAARPAGAPGATSGPGAAKVQHGDPLMAAAKQTTPEPAAKDKVRR